MAIPIIGQRKRPEVDEFRNPTCPICHLEMILVKGKKSANYACYPCKVAIGVADPLLLADNLKKEGTMMKRGDKVIIGNLEWEVEMVKGDRDVLIRRPNPKNRKMMDFGIVEVLDFVFDKDRRKWIEVDALPEDGDSLFKK